MSKRNDHVYLLDIVESIHLIEQYIGDKTEFEFSNDPLLQDAVYRRFEIIGEAASKISEPFRTAHPEIAWQLMKAMRNKLSHEYFGVLASTIYRTSKINLPPLKEKIQSLIG